MIKPGRHDPGAAWIRFKLEADRLEGFPHPAKFLSRRTHVVVVLAGAQVTGGQLGPHTSNVKWENNILSFEIAEKYKGNFVPVVSHCHNVPYITSSHWIKQIGPEYIVVMQSTQDTSGRTYPPTDFTVVIVGLNKKID